MFDNRNNCRITKYKTRVLPNGFHPRTHPFCFARHELPLACTLFVQILQFQIFHFVQKSPFQIFHFVQ